MTQLRRSYCLFFWVVSTSTINSPLGWESEEGSSRPEDFSGKQPFLAGNYGCNGLHICIRPQGEQDSNWMNDRPYSVYCAILFYCLYPILRMSGIMHSIEVCRYPDRLKVTYGTKRQFKTVILPRDEPALVLSRSRSNLICLKCAILLLTAMGLEERLTEKRLPWTTAKGVAQDSSRGYHSPRDSINYQKGKP
jgi:hypothetical protein